MNTGVPRKLDPTKAAFTLNILLLPVVTTWTRQRVTFSSVAFSRLAIADWFLPAAKPSRSRSGESSPPSPGEKSRIEYLGDLIFMGAMVIAPI